MKDVKYNVVVRCKGSNNKFGSIVGMGNYRKYPMVDLRTKKEALRSYNYYNGRDISNVKYGGYSSESGVYEARIYKHEFITTRIK